MIYNRFINRNKNFTPYGIIYKEDGSKLDGQFQITNYMGKVVFLLQMEIIILEILKMV